MATLAADRVGVPLGDILVASTGVIGQRLPLELIKAGIEKVGLSADGGHALAKAIMTTDTVAKEVALKAYGSEFIVGGVAKGSGMIHPQLGTLLCFLTTDARVDMDFLTLALRQAVDTSFNMVSIDGDTSPNDTVLIMASGLVGSGVIRQNTKQAAAFQQALEQVCIYLAKAIARDGEGAGKLIEVTVSGASSRASARLAARAVVASPLVKAAVHGSDPNWGRIVAAVGGSGAEVVEAKLDLGIGGVRLLKGGIALPFVAKKVVGVLKRSEVSIDINLNLGAATATAWGCDLSQEYVTINSRYTT
jgi:glutamate N-acetyltransferase/amino-acid N-acetyltransferase